MLLENIIDNNTKILFCGMAPGKESYEIGHYYAKKGNRFWNILYEIGWLNVVIEPSKKRGIRESNYNLLRKKDIGLTDLVKDQCGMDNGIIVKDDDIKRLKTLIKNRKNLQALAFNGKKPASKFLKISPKKLNFGYQEEKSKELGLKIYILPSTSGANARFDKKEWIKMSKLFQ